MWSPSPEIIEILLRDKRVQELNLSRKQFLSLLEAIQDDILYEFVDQLGKQVETIIEINPDLEEREILELATQRIVEFLRAHSATIRIYDPRSQKMLSYGSYPRYDRTRRDAVPLEGSVLGEVVRTGRSYAVPDLLKEERYKDKEIVSQLGVNSMLAIPLEIPRFSPTELATVGVIQIYYKERGKQFSKLEICVAELMSRRISNVIARKRVLDLHRLNEKKEAIVRCIFHKLGTREGIKMKEVFNNVIPELADIINIQSCALFSVSDDRRLVVIEAGYPEKGGHHGIGKILPLESEPYIDVVINPEDHVGETPYEVITPSYILVIDPQKSRLLSSSLKHFTSIHNINSILYIPMKVDDQVNYFISFDALDQRKRYTEEEIELFIFLGRELMKAHKMERLDDILHDFKNPAIATAGFARRLKNLLQQENLKANKEQINKSLDIVLEETTRLQELALSVYGVGKEAVVNMTERLIRRFEINEQAIKEQMKQNVTLKQGPFQDPLYVRCYPLHLERIFDNLLNNATNAIPSKGGELLIRTYSEGDWACAEISNTGRISDEDLERLVEGEGRGRGLHITHRIIHLLNGRIEVRVGNQRTIFIVRLPLYREEEDGHERRDRSKA